MHPFFRFLICGLTKYQNTLLPFESRLFIPFFLLTLK